MKCKKTKYLGPPPMSRPTRKMTARSYSWTILRVQNNESGKVAIQRRIESIQRNQPQNPIDRSSPITAGAGIAADGSISICVLMITDNHWTLDSFFVNMLRIFDFSYFVLKSVDRRCIKRQIFWVSVILKRKLLILHCHLTSN